MNRSDVIIILCTFPDEISAKNLTIKILSKKLAACVTIFPNVISFYYWKNKIKKKNEFQVLLKTNINCQEKLFDFLKFHHPYKTPEILSIPIIGGDKDYLSWINSLIK